MNDNFDFFGVKKKQKKVIPGAFSFLGKNVSPPRTVKVNANYWGAPAQKFGNFLVKSPKRKTTMIPQTYWSTNSKHVPIWLQENDDRRLGGKLKKGKNKPVSSMTDDEAKKELIKLKSQQKSKADKEMEVRRKFARMTEPTKKIFTLTTPEVKNLEANIYEKLEKRKMPTSKEAARFKSIQEKKLIYKRPVFGKVDIMKNKVQMTIKKDKSGNAILDKNTGKPIKVPLIDAKTGKQVVKSVKVGEKVVQTGEETVFQPAAIYNRATSIAGGVVKGLRATYGKEERVATAKAKRLAKAGLTAAFGDSILHPQTTQNYRGRPHGPSGKYMIEGKPVFEEEYQQWAAQQRAKNRITPSIAQEAPVTPEELQTLAAGKPTDNNQGMQALNLPETTTSSPMKPSEIEAMKQMMDQKRGPTNEDLRAAQEIAQQQDNILNAPSFMKGELKATGGSLLTPTGPQIMDAPNAFKGQLRTLNRTDPASMGEIHLSERPQTNPYGDEYIDIDLGSGKPVLKKRSREKWMTGEAL